MKKVIAVIPVYGRLPLLKYTIQRLLEKNGVNEVICVAETPEEKRCIEENGATFVQHKNQPLGLKWNTGFEMAGKKGADAVLFVGSSDWVSDNWLPEMLPLMDDYDLIGKKDFTMLDIDVTNDKPNYRMCHWVGYGKGEREKEPIGIGRLVSGRVLERFEWRPFADNKNNSMDYMMFHRVAQNDGVIGLVTGDHLVALSISTNAWPNMHKFEDHWNDKVPSKTLRINNMNPYFKMFPEYKKIFQ